MPAPEPDLHLAARLRGFGPVGIIAIVVVLAGNFFFTPLSAVLALGWARWSKIPLRELGFVATTNWLHTSVLGVVGGAGFKLLMKSVVMPLLGAPAINQAFHFLAGNPAALPQMLYVVLIGAAFGEETSFAVTPSSD